MKISIQFEDGQMAPMDVPVFHTGDTASWVSLHPEGLTRGTRLLKLRRRALRNWSRLFLTLEPRPEAAIRPL